MGGSVSRKRFGLKRYTASSSRHNYKPKKFYRRSSAERYIGIGKKR